MPQAAPVITIDGPSGSGKGTISRAVARALGWHFLDSGALYRAVGVAAVRSGADLADEQALARLALDADIRFEDRIDSEPHVWLGDEDISADIRTEEAGQAASKVAAQPAVRAALLAKQRAFQVAPGLVADGRDMGTIVFPEAELKVFLTASAAERARRRHKQLSEKGITAILPALLREIEERDLRDRTRSVAPLVPAHDARTIDSTTQSIDDVVAIVLAWAAPLKR
ncbi:MAG: (d)CMP kinase [Lysobacterales bacterium]|nr:(d)CMP kinase [Xanthomonadales bacterium]MCP5475806.1 (d)CMP kinase [Rhodanobacteraceae bacterium]